MPLHMIENGQPDLSDKHHFELRLEDRDSRRIVRVFFWHKALERVAMARGYKEDEIETKRDQMVYAVLDQLLVEASAAYDRIKPEPNVLDIRE